MLQQFVASKTKFGLSQGLNIILCIGESLETREANDTVPWVLNWPLTECL